jgi:DNA/RNA endonuclease YhcR with UshA esterase domain
MMFRRTILVFLAAGLTFGLAAIATAQAVASIGSISRADIKQYRTIQGTVTSYKPPTSDRAPHSLLVQDPTGIIRVAIWNDVWQQVPIRDQLTQPGAHITATVQVAEFRGNLEGHLNRSTDISPAAKSMSSAASEASPAPGVGGVPKVLSADPIPWTDNLEQAMAEARRTGKKILVFFDSRDAEVSRKVEVGIFADIRVRAIVQSKFIAARVSLTEKPDLAQRLGVFRAGVIGIYGPDGAAITQLRDLRTAEDFMKAVESL